MVKLLAKFRPSFFDLPLDFRGFRWKWGSGLWPRASDHSSPFAAPASGRIEFSWLVAEYRTSPLVPVDRIAVLWKPTGDMFQLRPTPVRTILLLLNSLKLHLRACPGLHAYYAETVVELQSFLYRIPRQSWHRLHLGCCQPMTWSDSGCSGSYGTLNSKGLHWPTPCYDLGQNWAKHRRKLNYVRYAAFLQISLMTLL